jgi:acetyltransferase-like isoleucine patch superfamily enzyme
LLLGARLGRNTHCPGVILDPPLVEIGDNVAIGFESVFTSHAAEGENFVLVRIRVGHRATIGMRAVIMAGVTIGEDAIVAAGAVVTKGTHIGPKEIWGGIPARQIKQ